MFGISTQADAEYLFEKPSEEDIQATKQPSPSGQPAAKKGETQTVRELTLRVSASPDQGGDSVELITFMPLVNHKAAPATPAGGGK